MALSCHTHNDENKSKPYLTNKHKTLKSLKVKSHEDIFDVGANGYEWVGLGKQKYYYNRKGNNRSMKGVKINNYIDNRIVVSDRKLKNQMQTLIQSSRPRPLVIRHLNYIEAEEEQHQIEKPNMSHDKNKNSDSKMAKKKKKGKNSCFSGNDQQQQEGLHRDRSKSRINKSSTKNILPNKKQSLSSSPKYRQDGSLDETQTKFRSASKNGQAIGKRSQSAIIKRNKSPSQILLDNQFRNNQDNSMKIKINKKKQEPQKKRNEKKSKPNRKNQETMKPKLNKNASCINIREKKNKSEKQSGSRTSRVNSKSYVTSSKQPKHVSARENKKKDAESNQLEKTARTLKKQYISLEELLCTTREDPKFKNAVSKLEEAINSKGSRKPIEKIELLVKKLQQIEDEDQKLNESESKNEMKIEINYKSSSQQEDEDEGEGQDLAFQQSASQDQNFLNNAFTNTKIVRNLLESENVKQKEAQSKTTTQILIKANQYKIEHENVRQLLSHENGVYEGQNGENPLIGHRNGGDSYFQLADYDSIKSVKSNHEENKQLEISEFKKFQQQSDMMMRKIKQMEDKKKQKEKIETEQNSEIIHTTPENKKIHTSPRNIEISNYAFQKYPIPDVLKSPKFNADGIIEVIKLRQKVFADRHQKLSELVNVLYTKQVVSPKTYNLQLNSLKQDKQQNNSTIDEYKKHAEELSQLLQQIKKQREEITSIDEIIRKENWDNAIDLIKTKEAQKRPSLQRQEVVPEHLNSQESSNSAAVYYYDDDEEISETGFKLVQVEELSQQTLNMGIEDNFKNIKDDSIQNQELPKRRGFQSNLFFIKQYCIALCEFTRDKHKQTFKERIGKPMSYNLPKLLKDFRTTTDNQPAVFFDSLFEDLRYYESNFHNNIAPISQQIFNEFNKQYSGIKYYGKEESEDATLEGIFLTSIFNALNESICIQKPASIHGEPLPWAHGGKHLKNLRNSDNKSRKIKQNEDSQDSEDLIFGISIARIIQWGSCLCGFIPDTAELQNTEIDEQYITHIRQTRTALLLQKMLNDQQSQMHRDELEITEVELNVARMIYEGMVEEMITEMKQLEKKGIVRTVDY